jgi:HlyD family secretion protein
MRALGLLVPVMLLGGCSRPGEEAKEKPVVAVKVTRADTADLPRLVTGPASIFPREQANIAARITAPIRELKARKGDSVAAGQLMAVLENRDLTAQRQEAQAALADAEANLQKTAAGTVPADVERARGQLETARASLDQAQKNYDRRRSLFEQGAIPQRDLLQSETELATARANFEVARKSLDLLRRQSGAGDIAIAKARVEQARARLAAATANLQYTDLRSPMNGVVTEQFQYPGDMAGPGTPTYTVMNLSTVTARAQIPETSAMPVQRGQTCAFTGADNATGKGRVTVVSRAVDPARRTVEVWCEIPNPPVSLRAGVFGEAAIETASIRGATVVPLTAVEINEGTGTGVVFVVDAKSIAHRREVRLGAREADRVQVLSGVQPGETVITQGGYALPDGTEVRAGGEGKP